MADIKFDVKDAFNLFRSMLSDGESESAPESPVTELGDCDVCAFLPTKEPIAYMCKECRAKRCKSHLCVHMPKR